jgi:Family of unknown function (DUF6232)
MLLNDLIKQDDSKKIVENPKFIEFSKRTIRFGDSICQIRNVSGFGVGKIPKQKLNIFLMLGSLGIGIFLLCKGHELSGSTLNGILGSSFFSITGIILLGFGVSILGSHFLQEQEYGFILELNSGGTISFVSYDKRFLGEIVSALYQLMEGDIDGLTVNWNDRSVKIYGDVKGPISTGENSKIKYNSQA